MIYHIALASDWQKAQHAGTYTVSTRGKSLEDVGFIHASYADQVHGTASAYYADTGDLVLLVIDPERLRSPLKPEAVGTQTFPHIYGPLNLDAVARVVDFPPRPDGTFALPTSIA